LDDLEQTTVYGPGDAADQLGVAPATLRRYASLYSSVFENLNTDNRGGYLYTAEVLERLSAAKRMQEQGQAVSLEQALLMLREGVEAPVPAKVEKSKALDLSEEARGTLAAILRDELRVIIREELAAVRQLEGPTAELEELRQTNAYLKGKLEQLPETLEHLQEQNRVLHEEIMALAPSKEDVKAEYASEMEEVHADLERRNRYLMGELERRDAEAGKQTKRPWWKWWA
jgi:DNA-binding transcriptional MerR regulator